MIPSKNCPCNSCGQTTKCISPDYSRFYCNRCLPYVVRQSMYPNETTQETKEEIPTNELPTVEKRRTGRKS